jgi:hypothetical protein
MHSQLKFAKIFCKCNVILAEHTVASYTSNDMFSKLKRVYAKPFFLGAEDFTRNTVLFITTTTFNLPFFETFNKRVEEGIVCILQTKV